MFWRESQKEPVYRGFFVKGKLWFYCSSIVRSKRSLFPSTVTNLTGNFFPWQSPGTTLRKIYSTVPHRKPEQDLSDGAYCAGSQLMSTNKIKHERTGEYPSDHQFYHAKTCLLLTVEWPNLCNMVELVSSEDHAAHRIKKKPHRWAEGPNLNLALFISKRSNKCLSKSIAIQYIILSHVTFWAWQNTLEA